MTRDFTAAVAPVSGRAPRRASTDFRMCSVLLLTLVGGLLAAPVASAHENPDGAVAAVLDRTSVPMPGLNVQVVTTRLGPQFVLENPTQTEVTILSRAGDPFLKIGPGGVLANFRSPEWYASKVPTGTVTVPEEAKDGGPPVWARISRESSWGWFDHRLHDRSGTPADQASYQPLQNIGPWSVPVLYGQQPSAIEGHFEYRPALGQFTPSLANSEPMPGVTVQALPGNPTPALLVQNAGPDEVVVLGDEGEPFLKIAPSGTQANALSPTWAKQQDTSGQAGPKPDAKAPPQWIMVGANGQYSFVLDRAGPTGDLAALYKIDAPTVVSNWTVTLLRGSERVDVAGQTTLVPIGSEPINWVFWLVAGVAALLVAAAVVLYLRRRRGAGPTAGTGSHRKVATPKSKKELASAKS